MGKCWVRGGRGGEYDQWNGGDMTSGRGGDMTCGRGGEYDQRKEWLETSSADPNFFQDPIFQSIPYPEPTH